MQLLLFNTPSKDTLETATPFNEAFVEYFVTFKSLAENKGDPCAFIAIEEDKPSISFAPNISSKSTVILGDSVTISPSGRSVPNS